MHILETLELVDSPTLIYLIDLRDGTVHDYFETEDESMVYATHIMNVWEEDGDKVVHQDKDPIRGLPELVSKVLIRCNLIQILFKASWQLYFAR